MTFEIQYSEEALEDLKGIYAYIAFSLNNPIAAKHIVENLRTHIRSLEMFPKGHEKVQREPWLSRGAYQFPGGNYLVFYFVNDDQRAVQISRIFYAKSNPSSMK